MRRRTETTKSEAVPADRPAPRTPQPLPEAVLRLQRSAGNAATTRAIQRKVGLEYQTAVKVKGPSTIKEGATIAGGDGWHIVADEVSGTTGDLEFVTDPFETAEELAAATAGAQAAAQRIKVDATSTMPASDPLSGIVPGAPASYTYEHSRAEVTAAPQTTWDVPLARISALLRMMEQPVLGARFGGEPTNQRTWSLSGGETDDAKMLAECAAFVENWFLGNVDEPQRYLRLMGLASLALSYLMSGAAHTATQPYAKLIAPVLARTSFSSLWRQLTPREKHLFDEHVGEQEDADDAAEDTPSAHFADWLLQLADDYAEESGREQPGNNVYAEGYKHETTGKDVAGPDVFDWLKSIVKPGVSGKDALSPPPGGSLSMGRYQARGPAAMLELRRLPKGLPATEWTAFAEHIFGLYLELFAAELEQRLIDLRGPPFVSANPYAALAET